MLNGKVRLHVLSKFPGHQARIDVHAVPGAGPVVAAPDDFVQFEPRTRRFVGPCRDLHLAAVGRIGVGQLPAFTDQPNRSKKKSMVSGMLGYAPNRLGWWIATVARHIVLCAVNFEDVGGRIRIASIHDVLHDHARNRRHRLNTVGASHANK